MKENVFSVDKIESKMHVFLQLLHCVITKLLLYPARNKISRLILRLDAFLGHL